ncbi:DUF551 domain-containing protein [Klebsiella pneumoniae]|uniref:DUF551 domain-containing protein n=1 Tax=Klebsiella TaxID=570 RepID=UPI0008DC19A8|nr:MULTISPECIES: DUF551 domain-containing protein [Klebsiella]AUX54626.1 hypothetical protein BU813_00020 [Klebsiella pneumoniae subsp. pneumoniae]AUX54676.1 hypothetical protein BU813_00295 [Klebsiella pneumoniae subsp. pneumoniae]AWE03304.1 DUF551 domain-containing protein [Klebsiella pneumoniae]AZH19337.1 DUF551 domain-containing protein [Klebsiella pneumoniae]ELA0338118.1 DUF551 domain-containing protein [Klebsiella pneumoniae]
MTKSTITRERAQQIFLGNGPEPSASEERELARMALAAMDSSESVELPIDYLQGHKDGLEWAAQLAEANHPETGDWVYDDPIELSKAIRKGPDMPPAQSVADSEPVIVVGDDGGDALSYRRLIQSFEPGTKLYRHAQPVPVVEREPIAWLNDAYLARGVIDGEAGSEDAGPGYIPVYREAGPQPATVVPDAATAIRACLSEFPESARDIVEECADIAENACRAAMLAAAPQSPGSEPATVPGEWIPVSEQMPPSRHEVLVGRWWGEKPRWCCKWATYIPGHPDAQSSGWLIPGASWTPTHWMPLPAAPQEPKP